MRFADLRQVAAFLLLVMGLTAAAPSVAQNKLRADQPTAGLIDGRDPAVILAIARGHGRATLGKDAHGDPQIKGEADRYTYLLTFYDCVGGRNCSAVMFDITFDDAPLASEDHNLWNRDNLVGTSMPAAGGGSRLYYSITLSGGILPATMDMHFTRWRKAVASYVDFLKENM